MQLSPNLTFTKFQELPTEIRLMIWQLGAPPPRIVHLTRKALQTDRNPNWWKSVRSDRAVEETGLKPIAVNAKYELRHKYRSDKVPAILHGLSSELGIPSILLACRESYHVACKLYSRTFGCSRAGIAQTFFNYRSDIMYLDQKSVAAYSPWVNPWCVLCGSSHMSNFSNNELIASETAQVDNLALDLSLFLHGLPYHFQERSFSKEGVSHRLNTLSRAFPNLKTFTLVEPFTHDLEKDFYLDLKVLQFSNDKDGVHRLDGLLRIHETSFFDSQTGKFYTRLPGQRLPIVPGVSFLTRLGFRNETYGELVCRTRGKIEEQQPPWRFPEIGFKILTSNHSEALLMDHCRAIEALQQVN